MNYFLQEGTKSHLASRTIHTFTEGARPENFYSEMAAGPELAFARALLRSGLSSKIGFIPAAIGGQGLFMDYCHKVLLCMALQSCHP